VKNKPSCNASWLQAQHRQRETSLQQQLAELSSHAQQLAAAAEEARREVAAAQGRAEAAARQRGAAAARCDLAERGREHALEQLRGAGGFARDVWAVDANQALAGLARI
jgi:hypothetical protein